jgi:formylglycine-generating enzyme required for sulfatase activity
MGKLSNRYLNIPLNAVIHPVPTEVQKVVKEEQKAVNLALIEKSEDIKELVKPVEEMSGEQRPTISGSGGVRSWSKLNPRYYGVGATILLIVVFAVFGVKFLQQSSIAKETLTPTQPMESIITLTAPLTSVPTQTNPPDAAAGTPPTAVPTLGVGSEMTSQKDGMTILYIPAGEFIMGREDIMDESPTHKVYLDSFWLDQIEVTNNMYSSCVEAGVCMEPKNKVSAKNINYYGNIAFNNYPVIYVDWNMAAIYCSWTDRRLPSEAEWEKAARGDEGHMYPWGNNSPNGTLLNYNNIVADTSSVMSYEAGKSPYGVYDMAGNVWEWVNDWYSASYYLVPESLNPLGPPTGQERVHRGGSFYEGDSFIYSSKRDKGDPSFVSFNLGFRCAVNAE